MAERNHIEGKFGQGKNGYNLNKIRAKLQNTAESWIAAIYFVMNLARLSRDLLFSYFLNMINKIANHLSYIVYINRYIVSLFEVKKYNRIEFMNGFYGVVNNKLVENRI